MPPPPPPPARSGAPRRRRATTVYDATTSLATFQGHLPAAAAAAAGAGYRWPAHAADEILGRRLRRRRQRVPYDADAAALLPPSDLLKAVHQYAAELFRRNGAAGRVMDEEALLAMGVLLEEAVGECLGGGVGGAGTGGEGATAAAGQRVHGDAGVGGAGAFVEQEQEQEQEPQQDPEQKRKRSAAGLPERAPRHHHKKRRKRGGPGEGQ